MRRTPAAHPLLEAEGRAGNAVTVAMVQRRGSSENDTREATPRGRPSPLDAGSPAGARETLRKRVTIGPLFSDRELRRIRQLGGDPGGSRRLQDLGVGTYEDATGYRGRGSYDDWLTLPPGRRLLLATIAFSARHRGGAEGPTPSTPDYTLGRTLQMEKPSPDHTTSTDLKAERDEQIVATAVATLVPPARGELTGLSAEDRAQLAKYAETDERSRIVLRNVLALLRHGLQVHTESEKRSRKDRARARLRGRRLPSTGEHEDYRDGPVIRALAHGGRVMVRIPPLEGEERATALLEELEVVSRNGLPLPGVERRDGATHRVKVTKHPVRGRQDVQEKGGTLHGMRNYLLPGDHRLLGVDVAVGGAGRPHEWHSEIVLPDGRHGHLLLVFVPPHTDRAGSLLIGLETVAFGRTGLVGNKHTVTSSAATANPESPLHGHKVQKIGHGELEDNPRMVDLAAVRTEGGGDWKAVIAQMKDWIEHQEDQAAAYRTLVGPRPAAGPAPGDGSDHA